MNITSGKDIFNKYSKELLKYSEGKYWLIQLVNVIIKTKDSYVAHMIDHTPWSCCQRGSIHSEQNHSSA